MRVDILVERVESWIVGFDGCLDRGLETRNIQLRVRRQKGCHAERGGHKERFGKMLHGNDVR